MAHSWGAGGGGTFIGIAVCGGLPEVEAASPGIRRGRKAEVRVIEIVVRGSDGFGGREGLERRGENDHEHCSREEAREPHYPEHILSLLFCACTTIAAAERSTSSPPPPPPRLGIEEIEEIEEV